MTVPIVASQPRPPQPLADAAAAAPDGPGVYFFLGARDELLYVGKATSLRHRLQQHARDTNIDGRRVRRVREVCWEILPTEAAAAAREADLIVALQPALNRAIVAEGRWTYLAVTPIRDERLRFALIERPGDEAARLYGCFPHLGKDVSSSAGIACSDGYVALLRLLWATYPQHEGLHYPTRVTHSAPPEFETPIEASLRASLHNFLSGRSKRLLGHLWGRAERLDAYMQPCLVRDFAAAEAFYTYGPAALRGLGVRHALRPGPVARETIEALLDSELRATIAAHRAKHTRVHASTGT